MVDKPGGDPEIPEAFAHLRWFPMPMEAWKNLAPVAESKRY